MTRLVGKLRKVNLSNMRKKYYPLVLFLMFASALAIRLYDLTDPPLDFNPTRQLIGGIISRGMYYQMSPSPNFAENEHALTNWNMMEAYEPPIFNRIVALSYLVIGSEQIWVARIYASLFWILGGWALYLLVKRVAPRWGAILPLGYYLYLPFGIIASRAFQPDPLMVMMILYSALSVWQWTEKQTWSRALIAGLVIGLTILVKVTAIFPLAGLLFFVCLSMFGLKQSLRNSQVWAIGLILLLIPSIYYLFILSGRSSDYFQFWTLSMWKLITPSFFVRWLSNIRRLVNLGFLLIAVCSMLISENRFRSMLLGLWFGYGIYGLFFPFQMPTHDYYHLMLVPIIALSLSEISQLFITRLMGQSHFWQSIFVGSILISFAYPTWVARSEMYVQNYRHEPAIWKHIGETIPTDGDFIALTHDYGYRLSYYGWRTVSSLWPTTADFAVRSIRGGEPSDLIALFNEITKGKKYFLVTLFSQLDEQPQLKSILFDGFPIYSEGDGYIIFDLSRTLNP